MLLLFFKKIGKELVLLMHFKKFLTIEKENQIKYGLIKVVNFTIVFLKNS